MQFGILSGTAFAAGHLAGDDRVLACGKRRETLAGVLLGVACAIKPQVVGPLLGITSSCGAGASQHQRSSPGRTICAVALLTMRMSHIDWYHGWKRSIDATMQVGAVNDYGWTAKFRDEIVDLKMLLVCPAQNPLVLRGMIGCIVLAWCCGICWCCCAGGRWVGCDELLAPAALSAIAAADLPPGL